MFPYFTLLFFSHYFSYICFSSMKCNHYPKNVSIFCNHFRNFTSYFVSMDISIAVKKQFQIEKDPHNIWIFEWSLQNTFLFTWRTILKKSLVSQTKKSSIQLLNYDVIITKTMFIHSKSSSLKFCKFYI